jgi:steroid 5-alpha reductase family enzyme
VKRGLRYASVSRPRSLIICVTAYLSAGAIALATGYVLRGSHPVLIAGIADLTATATVFIFSVIFDNSSLYDPYWSVIPVFIVLFWTLHPDAAGANTVRQIVVMVLLGSWAVRLTFNWVRRWRGLGHEDWRYTDFRKQSGRYYWPVSFAAIHLVPTVLVFAGCFSIYVAVSAGTGAFGILDFPAIIVTAAAIIIETVADRQLYEFLATGKAKGQVLTSGLWAYSRHPNYFGEVLFWWGLYLFAVAAEPAYWWAIFGPLAMTVLFVFISVPMIEKHMAAGRLDYLKIRTGVPKLLPRFPGKRRSNPAS